MSQVAYQAGHYVGFCSMKRLGVLQPPLPGWDANPLQGSPHPPPPPKHFIRLPSRFASTLLYSWLRNNSLHKIKIMSDNVST